MPGSCCCSSHGKGAWTQHRALISCAPEHAQQCPPALPVVMLRPAAVSCPVIGLTGTANHAGSCCGIMRITPGKAAPRTAAAPRQRRDLPCRRAPAAGSTPASRPRSRTCPTPCTCDTAAESVIQLHGQLLSAVEVRRTSLDPETAARVLFPWLLQDGFADRANRPSNAIKKARVSLSRRRRAGFMML